MAAVCDWCLSSSFSPSSSKRSGGAGGEEGDQETFIQEGKTSVSDQGTRRRTCWRVYFISQWLETYEHGCLGDGAATIQAAALWMDDSISGYIIPLLCLWDHVHLTTVSVIVLEENSCQRIDDISLYLLIDDARRLLQSNNLCSSSPLYIYTLSLTCSNSSFFSVEIKKRSSERSLVRNEMMSRLVNN